MNENNPPLVRALSPTTPSGEHNSIVSSIGRSIEISIRRRSSSQRSSTKPWAEKRTKAVGANYSNGPSPANYVPRHQAISNPESRSSRLSIAMGPKYTKSIAPNGEPYTSYTVATAPKDSVNSAEPPKRSRESPRYPSNWYRRMNIGNNAPISSAGQEPIYKVVAVRSRAMSKGNIRIVATIYAIESYYSHANSGILRTRDTAAMMANARMGAALRMENGPNSVYKSPSGAGGEASVDPAPTPSPKSTRKSPKATSSKSNAPSHVPPPSYPADKSPKTSSINPYNHARTYPNEMMAVATSLMCAVISRRYGPNNPPTKIKAENRAYYIGYRSMRIRMNRHEKGTPSTVESPVHNSPYSPDAPYNPRPDTTANSLVASTTSGVGSGRNSEIPRNRKIDPGYPRKASISIVEKPVYGSAVPREKANTSAIYRRTNSSKNPQQNPLNNKITYSNTQVLPLPQ